MKHRYLFNLLYLSLFLSGCSNKMTPPVAVSPLPETKQINWQKMETIAFVHFGLNTFNNKEWGYGDTDPQTFNPTHLNCEQWVQTFVKAGIKEVIITAKHHDGFCLWPTHLTDYCIRNTPYKNGHGDVVGELAAACKKYGLRFGIYLSPWDRHQANYGTSEYIEYFYKELHELLTRYGRISEIWFDGANGGDGWYGGSKEVRHIDRKTYYDFPRAYRMIDELQPEAIIFSDGGPGCRWIGNENGIAGATNWSFLRSKEVYPGYDKYYELTNGHSDGDKWVPGECDVSIRPGWFYHPEENDKVKTVNQLVDLYYKSVGHNAQFLLNFPIDREGLIYPTDSTNAIRYHEQIVEELKTDLLAGIKPKVTNYRSKQFKATAVTDTLYDTYWATKDGITKATITFRLLQKTKVNRMLLQEYIPLGQRVRSFIIEYLDNGKWNTVNPHEETTTIGYKRIVRFNTVETDQLRVRFLDARGSLCINRIAAYYSGNDNAFTFTGETDDASTLPFSLVNVNKKEAVKAMDKNDTTVCFIQDDKVIIDLGKTRSVSKLYLLPDKSRKRTGLISNYELSIVEGQDYQNSSQIKDVAKGEFSNIENNPTWQSIYFTPVDTRYLILKATRMIDNAKTIGLSEIRIR